MAVQKRASATAQYTEKSPRADSITNNLQTFLTGQMLAREQPMEQLAQQLSLMRSIEGTILVEGAFCHYACLDLISSGQLDRVHQFAALVPDHPGMPYAMFQGIGVALVQCGVRADTLPEVTNHFWGFMTVNCMGYIDGYLNWTDRIIKAELPPYMDARSTIAFDQGIGQALWSISSYHPKTMARLMQKFPETRLKNMWVGIGMVSSAVGMRDEKDLQGLVRIAGKHGTSLRVGIAMGLKAHVDNNFMPDYAKGACDIICGAKSLEVASLVQNIVQDVLAEEPTFSSFLRLQNRVGSKINE